MGQVVQMKDRLSRHHSPIIEKIVDGEVVRCTDVDALSAGERERYFDRQSAKVFDIKTHAGHLRPA